VCVNLERHDRGHVSNPAHEEGNDVDDTQSEGKKSQNERVIKKSLKDEVGNKRLLTAPPPLLCGCITGDARRGEFAS